VVFAPGITAAREPVDAMSRFPEGVTKAYAVFTATLPLSGSQWHYEWYRDGKLQANVGRIGWDLAAQESAWVNVWKADGLSPGQWELRLYSGDRLDTLATFTVERRQPTAPGFGPIRFAEGAKDDKPQNVHRPMDVFVAGTKVVYAFFNTANLAQGLPWKREWTLDGVLQPNLVTNGTWTGQPTETDFWVRMSNEKGLPAGVYELKLYVEDKLVQLGTTVVAK
jgi:hypothetical protein